MRKYQLESVVNEHGMIVLPDEMKNLHKHRVKIVITDLGAEISEPCDFLDHVTEKYAKIEEEDLNLDEIYKKRDHIDERKIMEEFILSRADDFEAEVEAIRNSPRFQSFLDKRMECKKRFSVEDVEKEVEKDLKAAN